MEYEDSLATPFGSRLFHAESRIFNVSLNAFG